MIDLADRYGLRRVDRLLSEWIVSSEGYSIPYIASWAEKSRSRGLEHTAALVDRLARRIEDVALGVAS